MHGFHIVEVQISQVMCSSMEDRSYLIVRQIYSAAVKLTFSIVTPKSLADTPSSGSAVDWPPAEVCNADSRAAFNLRFSCQGSSDTLSVIRCDQMVWGRGCTS